MQDSELASALKSSAFDAAGYLARSRPEDVALQGEEGSLTYGEIGELLARTTRVQVDPVNPTQQAFFVLRVDDSLASHCAVVLLCAAGINFVPVAEEYAPEAQAAFAANAVIAGSLSPTDVIRGTERLLDHAANQSALGGQIAILTSGSTGLPKAVLYNWSTIEPRLRLRTRFFSSAEAKVVNANVAPVHFSFGLFLTLTVLAGAKVVVANLTKEGARSSLHRLINQGINRLTLTNEVAFVLSKASGNDKCPTLLRVLEITGGHFDLKQLGPLIRLLRGDGHFISSYSASEAMAIMEHIVPADQVASLTSIGVGSPREKSAVRLVPSALRPDLLSVHVSSTLALGYSNEALNAERFYRDQTGNRWWISGDLVSSEGDGTYRHAGREDDVVKVQGKSISLNEVERVLEQHRDVVRAAVMTKQAGGRIWLVAHCESTCDSELRLQSLRTALLHKLPAYLRPREIVFHTRLPMTNRGKIDRAGLREVSGNTELPKDVPS